MLFTVCLFSFLQPKSAGGGRRRGGQRHKGKGQSNNTNSTAAPSASGVGGCWTPTPHPNPAPPMLLLLFLVYAVTPPSVFISQITMIEIIGAGHSSLQLCLPFLFCSFLRKTEEKQTTRSCSCLFKGSLKSMFSNENTQFFKLPLQAKSFFWLKRFLRFTSKRQVLCDFVLPWNPNSGASSARCEGGEAESWLKRGTSTDKSS